MRLEVQSLTAITTPTGTQFVPSGEAIGTGTTTESIEGELIFEFATPPQLIAGIEYALVLNSLYTQTLQWDYSSLNTYSGGVRLNFVDPFGWERVPTEDYAFTTIMVASADPRLKSWPIRTTTESEMN